MQIYTYSFAKLYIIYMYIVLQQVKLGSIKSCSDLKIDRDYLISRGNHCSKFKNSQAYKWPMGHIANLRNQLKSKNIWEELLKFWKPSSSFENWMILICKTSSFFTQECFVTVYFRHFVIISLGKGHGPSSKQT